MMRTTACLLLAILLAVDKVHSLPYETGPGGSCNNTNTEYVPENSDLCCKKCVPGTRFRKQCSASTETECGQCPNDQYTETYHYFPNCFKCLKCNEDKGLQYLRKCTTTTRTRCKCLPGKYCTAGFKNQHCEACTSYTSCKPGHGVSRQGSADSDVRCEPCSDGTFSDLLSYTQPCQKHTDCVAQGSIVLRPGNSTSDSVCERYNPQTTAGPTTPTEPETTSQQATTLLLNTSSTLKETSSETSLKAKNSVAPSDDKLSQKNLDVLAWSLSVFGLLIFLAIAVLVSCKIRQKDYKPNNSSTDSNGNCEVVNIKDSPCTSVTFPEQQRLLTTGHHGNNLNQELSSLNGSSGNQENTPTPHRSSTQMFTYQTQPSSLPSSPQSPVSPLPSNPLVNVNITLNVGNGCCSALSSLPTDSLQTNFKNPPFPLGKEEECVSVAQQEEGKGVLVAVQESEHSLENIA